jgi:16S rRNA (guanine1207-N2)-methyltransferase
MVALAPKDRGGTRLAKELAGFGCAATDQPRRHHRICSLDRPPEPTGIAEAIDEGAPRHVDNLALCTQPGIFSWDRLDPGTALLLANLPPLKGRGADFGCGLGILSRAVLGSEAVTALTLLEIDRRAVEMARRNVADPRVTILWSDIRTAGAVPDRLDFVVTNPPFHDGGIEDQALGRTFIARAAESLRPGGTLWLVANAHLPYEAALREAFRSVSVTAQAGGYRAFEARR